MARSLSRWLEPADDALHLAIHARSDDEFVGFCHVAFIDRHNRRCKLGLTIGEPHARRIGYGKEAVGELVRHCFEDLGLNRVAAEVYDFNPAAVRLLERLGFRREGVLRQNVWKGEFRDEWAYGLLASEWASRSTGPGA